MNAPTHLSLFSGIGGLDIAAEMAGFRTAGQCEWADYPTKVLEKHWPDVPRWRDIRTLTGGSFYERAGLRTVEVISGGFPCQPVSVAGKRRGKEDDRYLWPEMFRVIHELRPAWVVGENVAGLVTLGLDEVLSDLESIGYACQAFIIPACAVDSAHRRDRCAIIANAYGSGFTQFKFSTFSDKTEQFDGCYHAENGLSRESFEPGLGRVVDGVPAWVDGYWLNEPDIPRITTEKKNRVDRLKCLGNAVVWRQFYPIFEAIRKVEKVYET